MQAQPTDPSERIFLTQDQKKQLDRVFSKQNSDALMRQYYAQNLFSELKGAARQEKFEDLVAVDLRKEQERLRSTFATLNRANPAQQARLAALQARQDKKSADNNATLARTAMIAATPMASDARRERLETEIERSRQLSDLKRHRHE